MKTQKTKKLDVNKITVSNLDMNKIQGGAAFSRWGDDCLSVIDGCPSQWNICTFDEKCMTIPVVPVDNDNIA